MYWWNNDKRLLHIHEHVFITDMSLKNVLIYVLFFFLRQLTLVWRGVLLPVTDSSFHCNLTTPGSSTDSANPGSPLHVGLSVSANQIEAPRDLEFRRYLNVGGRRDLNIHGLRLNTRFKHRNKPGAALTLSVPLYNDCLILTAFYFDVLYFNYSVLVSTVLLT